MRKVWMVITAVMFAVGLGSALWAAPPLTDQQDADQLVAAVLSSLTTGDPPLSSLLSAQGSVVLLQDASGAATATRPRLNSDPLLAARFRLPGPAAARPHQVRRVGSFLMGTVFVDCIVPAPPLPPLHLRARPTRFLAEAYWRPARRDWDPAFAWPGTELAPKTVQAEWWVGYAAVREGRDRAWRLVSLCVAPTAATVSEAEAQGAVSVLWALQDAMRKGDFQAVRRSLNPDPFCAAAYTPDGAGWFFSSAQDLAMMVAGMGGIMTGGAVPPPQVTALVSGQVALVNGNWDLDIPTFGRVRVGLQCTMVRTGDGWALVTLCAAPENR